MDSLEETPLHILVLFACVFIIILFQDIFACILIYKQQKVVEHSKVDNKSGQESESCTQCWKPHQFVKLFPRSRTKPSRSDKYSICLQ